MILFNLKGGTYCIDIEEQAKVLLSLFDEKELKDISKYTGEVYITINKILKNKEEKCSTKIQKIIDTVNRAFTELPPFKHENTIILYRGLKLNDDNYHQFLEKEEINDLGFISTSTNIETAYDFAWTEVLNSLIMKIYLSTKYNNKILPVKKISKMSYENEVILPNGSRFVWIKKFPDESIENGIIRSYLYIPVDEISSQPNSFVEMEDTVTKYVPNSAVNAIVTPKLIQRFVHDNIDSDNIDVEELLEEFKKIIKNKKKYGILPATISKNKIFDIKKQIEAEIIKQKLL